MSAIDFRINCSALGASSYVVSVGGEADLHTAPELDHELRSLAGDGVDKVVVDLSGASFIDSTLLGVLLRHHRKLRSGGGELVLAADDIRIRRTFEITGLDRTFTIERTLPEAIERLSARGAPA